MLSDSVLVVTGAGRGIGRAVAIELAGAGATVVVNDLGASVEGEGANEDPARETVATIEAAGGTATAHVGDVTDPSYTASLLADAAEAHGRVDGVANFAGAADPAPIHEMSLDQWERVVDVHLRGHFCLLRSAARQWIDADGDRDRSFLCVSSQSALGHYAMANYTAAKAGILGLMRTAANELAEHGVRVNALFPSGTTRLSDALTDDAYRDPVPPEQVAPMVAYLLGDAAADVTGCTFRAGGEEIGFVTDPEMSRLAYREDGWTAEAVAEQFPDVTAGIDLDRSETLVSERYGLDAEGMGG
ncbi:SDR family NAD(P)-dependent oxidoreductase [Haloplanus halophilus]|uniref:SDR family NAD(P)-dependent oxidoreductase n=1 Tax=Haloplanus halophilus TaxID=2949993 RepID=UPI00203C7EAA|nr:SDR family NAD(P)-dependent oxidoreductase [Haloplanus sp. GDY1]